MIKPLFLLLTILALSSCDRGYYEEEVTLVAINETLDCEEENIFYRMLSSSKKLDYIKNNRDSIILFTFFDEMIEDENYYGEFFPTLPVDSEKLFKVKVSGVFHKNKNQGKHYHHCIGSSIFVIQEVIEFEDITDEAMFPVRY